MTPAWAKHLIGKSTTKVETTDYARCLIIGEFGSGKTKLASTFPKPFFIDVDYGMATTKESMDAKPADGIRLFRGDKIYETIMAFVADAKKKTPPLDQYQTIVLDGITSLSKILLEEIIGGPPDPKTGNKASFDEYQSLKVRLSSVINAIQQIPYHVVMTALTSIEKDEATGSFVGQINTVGSFNKDLGSLVDEVYYMDKRRARSNEDGDAVYEAYTQFHPRFAVKSRLQQAAKIPSKVVNPTFDSLYGSVYKGKA